MDLYGLYLLPAYEEFFPESKARSRLLKNLEPDEDGYVILHYFADPYSVNDIHRVGPILSKKYSEEEAERLTQEFLGLIGKQTATFAVQLAW
jgi:hypothetical protein